MRVSLLPLDPPPSLRFFIRADGLHAGGITVHSVSGARFSYGIAVSGAMRRRGVASSALPLLFAAMKARGFAVCAVQIAPDNAASLALHRCITSGETPFMARYPEECTRDAEALGAAVHEAGALYVMGCNPIALAIMKTPRDCGADIAVGEGQPLGLPLAAGGPYLGYMATTEKHMRKLPGRIVGETTDAEGRRAYVLSLQAREQHIRREKASSNICSNEALCALTAGLYMSTMGPDGMAQAAEQSMAKAHYLADALCAIDGVKLLYDGDFFHEFVTVSSKDTDKVLAALEKENILGGQKLDDHRILWCCTEMNTKEDMDLLVRIVKEV